MPEHRPAPLTPDLCIIGAGPAGLAVATAAGALGVPTIVVDKEDLGRTLPRAGDVARQVLFAAARARAAARRSVRLGFEQPSLKFDWATLRRTAEATAEAGAPDMSAERLGALGVRVIRAAARFTDTRTIEAGTTSIRARRFILATGSAPAVPSVPGLDLVPVLNATSILDLSHLPSRLIVLGAGSTGLELAQALRRLGSEVVVLESGTALRDFDPELTAPVLARLAAEGVVIIQNVHVLRADSDRTGVRLIYECRDEKAAFQRTVAGSHLLAAAGWRPNVAGLRLDAGRIRCGPAGIVVGPNGRTSNRQVFAIGDVVGLGRSMQSAQAQADVALRAALFRQPTGFHPLQVPRIIYTDPEVAVVGMTEAQARERAGRLRILRWPFSDNARAKAEGRSAGHAKVITTREGRVLGAGIVGPEASELIGLWSLAIAQGLKASDIAALAMPHASYSDVSRRAAVSALAAELNNPWVQRALRVIRLLG